MKLSQINYELSKPKKIELLDPSTNKSFENPAFIEIMSIESSIGKTVQLNIFRDMVKYREDNKVDEISPEIIKDISAKHLSKLLVGWEGFEDDNGNELKYSEEEALRILSEYDIVFNAVNINSALVGNFLKK